MWSIIFRTHSGYRAGQRALRREERRSDVRRVRALFLPLFVAASLAIPCGAGIAMQLALHMGAVLLALVGALVLVHPLSNRKARP